MLNFQDKLLRTRQIHPVKFSYNSRTKKRKSFDLCCVEENPKWINSRILRVFAICFHDTNFRKKAKNREIAKINLIKVVFDRYFDL